MAGIFYDCLRCHGQFRDAGYRKEVNAARVDEAGLLLYKKIIVVGERFLVVQDRGILKVYSIFSLLSWIKYIKHR